MTSLEPLGDGQTERDYVALNKGVSEFEGMCDSHMHVVDDRSSATKVDRPNHSIDDYTAVASQFGLSRAVVVQPSFYGFDNSATLDAVKRLGANGRGIVVIPQDTERAVIGQLDEQGVRGIRLNLVRGGGSGLAGVGPLVDAMRDFGWHIQIVVQGDKLPDMAEDLIGLDIPIVVDHMGRIPQPNPASSAGMQALRAMVDSQRVWVKLSAPYLTSDVGSPYGDVDEVAQLLVRDFPDRLVWGSDWPHTTESPAPDDDVLWNIFNNWMPAETTRRKVLVENPAKLYRF